MGSWGSQDILEAFGRKEGSLGHGFETNLLLWVGESPVEPIYF